MTCQQFCPCPKLLVNAWDLARLLHLGTEIVVCIQLFFAVDLLQWAQSPLLLSFQERLVLASLSSGFPSQGLPPPLVNPQGNLLNGNSFFAQVSRHIPP